MPVNVARWPGARVIEFPEQVATGLARLSQVGPVVSGPAGAVGWSVTFTSVSDVFPVFVTTKVYVMVWPAELRMVGLADFTMEIDEVWLAVTEAVAVAETGVPEGAWPVAVAESAMEPWSMSAWVTV